MACVDYGCVEQKNNLQSQINANNNAINEITTLKNGLSNDVLTELATCQSSMDCVSSNINLAVSSPQIDFSALNEYKSSLDLYADNIASQIDYIDQTITSLTNLNNQLSSQLSSLGDCSIPCEVENK